MAPYLLFSFLQTVACQLRYGPNLYTLPSLSLKLLSLSSLSFPFRFYFIIFTRHFSSSIVAGLEFCENQSVDLFFPIGSPKLAIPPTSPRLPDSL